MESRQFGGGRPRGGRGKSNFGSRDYRMEGRRDQNNSRGGGGGGRYGNSGSNSGGKYKYLWCCREKRNPYFKSLVCTGMDIKQYIYYYID